MLNKLITTFLLTLLSTSLLAENTCPSANSEDKKTKVIDLRAEMPPIRDQDSVGWCYAFTAADLMTHYLYKTKGAELKNPDKKANYLNKDYALSAVGVAGAYNKIYEPNYLTDKPAKNAADFKQKYSKRDKDKKITDEAEVFAEGGHIADAVEAAKSEGICYEKDLHSDNFTYVKDMLCVSKNYCNLRDELNLIYDSVGDTKACINNAAQIQKLVPSVTVSEVKDILLHNSRQEAMKRLLSISCKGEFETHYFSRNKPVVHNSFYVNDKRRKDYCWYCLDTTPESVVKELDEALDKGKPVGIAYNPNFLYNIEERVHHASSIVGKRFNPKTCEVEYILKNSWGNYCPQFKKENPGLKKCVDQGKNEKDPKKLFYLKEACKESFPPVYRNPKVSCDSATGYLFIAKSDLINNIDNVTTLDEE